MCCQSPRFAAPLERPVLHSDFARMADQAAYWRTDALEKRKPMMDAWGGFCIPAKAAKVIPFTAA